MSEKTLNFQLDEDCETLTLSKSARISLSDITAATIGNLSEDPQWADNSNSPTESCLPVLRPWEDNSESVKSGEITPHMVYPDKQPPTYQEHLKRKLDADDENINEENLKRLKTEPSSFTKDATVLYSYIVAGTSTNNSSQDDTQNSLQDTSYKNLSQQTYDNLSTQDTSFQNFMPAFTTKNTLQNVNVTTQNPLLNVITQNPLQNVTTMNSLQDAQKNSIQYARTNTSSMQKGTNQTLKQPYLPIDQGQLTVTTEASSANHNSNKIYLPWTNSPVLNDMRNIQSVEHQSYNKQYIQQTVQPAGKLLTNPSSNTLPPLFKPQQRYPMVTQINQRQPLQPALANWQSSTISTEQQKQPSRLESINLPAIQPVPTYLHMTDILQATSAPEENKSMQSPWQHMGSCQPWENQPKRNNEVKEEPATPTGKGLMTMSKFDSPAMDSRFTESLSNLLGSPPPDSPLSKNPFLGDLQALLNRECKREIVPQSLFGMQGSNHGSTDTKKNLNVFERERNLQERFTNLQSSHPEDIKQLSSMFRYQSALIETERFRTLHECQYPGSYKESVNRHYDNQLHKVMDRVERSVELIENSNKENTLSKAAKMRPHLSKGAVRLMQHWYQQNLNHPYPTSSVIEMLAQAGNIGIEQVKKWFANKRNRSSNTRSLTEIAMQKRKLGQMPGQS